MGKVVTRTTADYVKLAQLKHGDVYDYSETEYVIGNKPIRVICNIHGMFTPLAYKHLQGTGCRQCGRQAVGNRQRRSLASFVKEATVVHNGFFTYERTEQFNRTSDAVIITCPKHGDFTQSAKSHLRGLGCAKCTNRISRAETEWLDSLQISTLVRQYVIQLSDRRYHVDGFDPETNTVYEYWGDYWHGNPQLYQATDINPHTNLTFGVLYEATVDKVNRLRENGFNVVEMWEQEWKTGSKDMGE